MADSSAPSLIERAELILSRMKEMSDAIWAYSKSHNPENVRRVAEAWDQLRPAIIEVGKSLPPESNPVTDWILEVARVSRWFRDKLNKFSSLDDVLFECDGDKFIVVYEKGLELFKSMETKQDPFAFVDGPGLTLLDRFPATPSGHLKFLEFVRDGVRDAADAKRNRLQHGYSNATIESMVRGIKWSEAGRRVSMLTELPADVVEQVDLVLRRELSIGTVEQIDEWFTPAIRNLRNAWECAKNEVILRSTEVSQETELEAESQEGKNHGPASVDAGGTAGGNDLPAGEKTTNPTSRTAQRAQWLAQAMLLVRDHPDWSDAEIARRVGKDKSTLSRSKEYKAAAAMARGAKDDRHRGHISVDPDSGLREVEAYSDDPSEHDWDD